MKNRGLLFFAILLFAIVIPCAALADLGPKPSATIYITKNGLPIQDTIFDAELLICKNEVYNKKTDEITPQLDLEIYDADRDCYWTTDELIWNYGCRSGMCSFSYYVPSKFKLAVYLPSNNKTYISDVTTREAFNSFFAANLQRDGSIETAEISNAPIFMKNITQSFIISLIITLILELVVAWLYVTRTKKSKRILIFVVLGSIISLPVVWFSSFMLPAFINNLAIVLIVVELFAVFFEAWFIYICNRKYIHFKEALLLSFVMNLVSFIVGRFIY